MQENTETRPLDIRMHKKECTKCEDFFETTHLDRLLCSECLELELTMMATEPTHLFNPDYKGDD